MLLSTLSTRGSGSKMSVPPVVFLDTTALKFASERLIRGRVRATTANWGGQKVQIDVTQFVEHYPNAGVDGRLARELERLAFIAHLARKSRVRLTTHFEALWEYFGLPKIDDPRGRFYGAPIENAPNPFEYGRTVASGLMRRVDFQFDFLKGISNARFRQLTVAVGANPKSKRYKNQLLDAFLLLCAESANANYFLTLDFKLMRHVAGHRTWPPRVTLVTPRELVNALSRSGHARVRDTLSFARHMIEERSNPSDHLYEQLVKLGKRLEKRGMFDG
jgi:hypothetical protein